MGKRLFYGKKSLTLIELVIVMTIIAILTATGLVSFSIIAPRQLEAEARKIVSDLCWVRQLAVAKHEDYIIDFDTTNERYIIYRGSISPANEIKRQNLEVDLVSVNPSPQLRFVSHQGIAQAKDINLSHQGRTKQIRVFGETGYVRTE